MGINDERRINIHPEMKRLHEPETIYPPHFEVINSLLSPESPWLGLARNVVGEGYVSYYHKYLKMLLALKANGQFIDKGVYGELCSEVAEKMYDDQYSHSNRSVIVTALASNGDGTNRDITGTSRIVLGKNDPDNGLAPLEVMDLAEPDVEGGWTTVIEGKSLDRFCEVGRVVVPKGYRDQGMTTMVVKQLIDGENGVVDIAQAKGIENVVMIAQRRFAKHAKKTSLDFSAPIDIKLRDEGERIANTFPGYWRDIEDRPKLYIATVPPKR